MISAKIICDSVSGSNNNRITTFELEYPRFIHSELMTHRMFSRNAASSRAIPITKMMDMVLEAPATPVEWGLNQAGMQAKEVHANPEVCKAIWELAAQQAVHSAEALQNLGLHKQIVNRVLEPFQTMKTIVTGTEFDNFFWLRCHKDAQPEIHVLADLMYEEYINSTPQKLKEGEWHLPYIDINLEKLGYTEENWLKVKEFDGFNGTRQEYLLDLMGITLEQAKKISASCCAQVSYRKLDESLDKAIKIYDQLVTMTPVHASPFEHLATPIPECEWNFSLNGDEPSNLNMPEGLTHEDRYGNLWSGNFKGWIQYRQLIDNNTCWRYEQD